MVPLITALGDGFQKWCGRFQLTYESDQGAVARMIGEGGGTVEPAGRAQQHHEGLKNHDGALATRSLVGVFVEFYELREILPDLRKFRPA